MAGRAGKAELYISGSVTFHRCHHVPQPTNRSLLAPAPPPPSLQGWCALILIAFMVFFRLIALLALKRLNFQQR